MHCRKLSLNILYDDQGSKMDFQQFSSLQVKKTRKVKKSRANRKLLLFASCRSTSLITSSPKSVVKVGIRSIVRRNYRQYLHHRLAAFFNQSWHKHKKYLEVSWSIMKYLEHGQRRAKWKKCKKCPDVPLCAVEICLVLTIIILLSQVLSWFWYWSSSLWSPSLFYHHYHH